MTRGILIATVVCLGVPAGAAAKPRKKPKASKPPPAETSKPDPAPEATTPTPPPDAATLTPGSGKSGAAPTPAGTAKPGTPSVLGSTPGTPPTPTTGPATGAGAGTGSAAADPPEGPPTSKELDVDALRQEYLSLRDELFKSRARANAVASQLYSTRVTIKFTWGSARHYGVSKASIRIDGATVYENATGAIAADDGIRFNGYIAPGKHLVTFHVEATGKDDDSFTSSTEAQVVVKAVANKDLIVSAKGRDSGDIAYAWKRGERGSYGLGIDVAVKSVAGGKK